MPAACGIAARVVKFCLHDFRTPVGIEPTLNRFAGDCRTIWLRRQSKCPRWESNPVFDLRRVACRSSTLQGQECSRTSPGSRTPSSSFEDCRAIRHTRKAFNESRRLELHQHHPVYKTGAFYSATSAFCTTSTSARIRTPSSGFGGRLLSQEHARVVAHRLGEPMGALH